MERLKNMGLKKSFFFLSVWCILISPLPVLSVFLVCNATKSGYPPGSMNMRDGVAIPLEQPTAAQKQVINLLTYFQWLSCIVLPVSGLGFGAVLSYRIKLKRPIDLLRDGTEHIRANDLNFSIPAASTDELGQICAAFETMRLKLLKTSYKSILIINPRHSRLSNPLCRGFLIHSKRRFCRKGSFTACAPRRP